jgi:hypothetical protein
MFRGLWFMNDSTVCWQFRGPSLTVWESAPKCYNTLTRRHAMQVFKSGRSSHIQIMEGDFSDGMQAPANS